MTREIDSSMKAALDAVEAVPDINLRAELRVAWMENLRLRRLLDAMVDVDGTQVGIVETYVCDPRAAEGTGVVDPAGDPSRIAGVGAIVCCAGDEDALALHAGAVIAHLMGVGVERARIEARSALEVSGAVAARRREAVREKELAGLRAMREAVREKELAGLRAMREACKAVVDEYLARATADPSALSEPDALRYDGATKCLDALDALLAARSAP